jgi:putative FmdB family regulatory protein
MPTYEYRCKACKHEFEEFQSMKDKALTKCPACGKKSLERLIGTGAAIVFKGSGFWQTDYRSESYKKAAEADKPPEKSDSKPAEKSSEKAGERASDKPSEKATDKPRERANEKAGDKSGEKSGNKPAEKPAEKSVEKKTSAPAESKPAKSSRKK